MVAIAVVLLLGLSDHSLESEVEQYLARTEPVSVELQPSWANRMRFESVDGAFRLDLIGWILWDNAWQPSDELASPNLTLLRSVRLGAQGHAYQQTVYKFQLEFARAEVGLRDLFVGLGRGRTGSFVR